MIVQYIINGLTMGMVYALIAVGYSLIFGVLRLVNMAHGTIYAFGAHMLLMFVSLKWGIVPGIIMAIITTCVFVSLFDKGVLLPIRKKGAPNISALISTIGFAYVIQNLLLIVFGTGMKSFPSYLDFGIVEVFGLKIQSSQICIFAVAMILLILFSLIIYKSKSGLAMRAVASNGKAASLMGIDGRNVVAFTFILSGISAVVAAFLVSNYYQLVYPTMGNLMGLKAFSAAVLGGIGILYGSIVGALVLGLAESFAVLFLSGAYRDATAFLILIVVLIFKPNGLFGKNIISKV